MTWQLAQEANSLIRGGVVDDLAPPQAVLLMCC